MLNSQKGIYHVYIYAVKDYLKKIIMILKYTHLLILLFLLLLIAGYTPMAVGQTDSLTLMQYDEPKEYEIGGVRVSGATFSDENAVVSISGLRVGEKIRIPGPDISNAVKALWKLKLFTDIQIVQSRVLGDVVFLDIIVTELPRLSKYSYKGVKKSYHSDLNADLEKILLKGGIVTDNTKQSAISAINKFFREKGFLDVNTTVDVLPDEKANNAIRLEFNIERGSKVKIRDIFFTGNDEINDRKLRKKMKNTNKKSKLFSSSKLIAADYKEDKESIVRFYNSLGYRDARVVSDSIWRDEDGYLIIRIDMYEGPQYYFRHISWKGNNIYTNKQLTSVLGIEKGDVYNQELLEKRLSFSEDGRDVSSLYMDDGYLFFNAEPIEVAVENDSIDIEMRIFEGPPATIDKVIIKGNDRTHEHVIRRELRTLPGRKFSRSDIIRSQRQLMNLGYFDPETMDINTPVNYQRGTVDIVYTLEEKPSDQLELSAGYSFFGVIGTLGVVFNNFSMRNIGKKEAWSPLPQGDGQKLSVRVQSNGRFSQAYNLTFTEPWLGGKKPTSFTVAGFYNKFTNGSPRNSTNYGFFAQGGVNIGLGTRLRWPDDNFLFNATLAYENMEVRNYNLITFVTDFGERLNFGSFNNVNINLSLTRTTIGDPIFPREGSKFLLSATFSPPYSLFDGRDSYGEIPPEQRYRWLEYHKWKAEIDWYKTIVGKLVFRAHARVAILGHYNPQIGNIPFERFEVGGDGLSNQFIMLAGRDIISARGYDVGELALGSFDGGASVYNKFDVELRYPISLNPSSSIYVLTFLQGVNAFNGLRNYNPFDLRRSFGMGVRVFLPMFGTLGFDYGIGFDKDLPGAPPHRLTDYGRFNVILGFEPE